VRRFDRGVLERAVWVAETEATRDFISTFLPEHSESDNTINVIGEGLYEIGITAARPFLLPKWHSRAPRHSHFQWDSPSTRSYYSLQPYVNRSSDDQDSVALELERRQIGIIIQLRRTFKLSKNLCATFYLRVPRFLGRTADDARITHQSNHWAQHPRPLYFLPQNVTLRLIGTPGRKKDKSQGKEENANLCLVIVTAFHVLSY
jgi:hypothetical protein